MDKLVSIPSVFPEEQELSDYIYGHLLDLGWSVELVSTGTSRANIVAKNIEAEHYLGFYGHLDTVPPAHGFKHHPFSVTYDNDKAYGLGTFDMKGGLSCILKASEYAMEHKIPVKLIFGVDEENISLGAHDLVNSGLLNNIKFLISAESGQVKDTNLPFSVVYGRKGRIFFNVKVHGKSAHAAEAVKGINAINKAADLIHAVSEVEFPSHPILGDTSIVVQNIESFAGAFSVPASCWFEFSLITTPSVNSEWFIERFSRLTEDLEIQASISPVERDTPYNEAYEVDTSDPFLKSLEENLLLPSNVMPIYTNSVADENVFANRLKIPVISLGPVGGNDHSPDEWVSINSLNKVHATYQAIISLYKNSYC